MPKSHKINLIIIVILSLVFGWQLLRPGFFSTHDDLQVMRMYEMDKCFQHGQIPCRWSPDMGAGYGQAMFNYYSATPYYTGEFFRQFSISFVNTTKILFFLCILFAGVFSYLFFLGLVSPSSALIGSVIYMLTPYRALDVFVRGALSEAFALTLIPVVLYFIIRTIKSPRVNNSLCLSVTLALFVCTHNITSLTSLFVLVPFTIVSLFYYGVSFRKIKALLYGGLLGLGLSAFFVLPIAFERNLIQTNFLTQGYFDFNVHFVSLKQLFFSTLWGYGPSEPGTNDNLSFAVGIIQSLVLLIYPIVLFFNKKKKKLVVFGSTFWILSLVTIFMTHNQSAFIWKLLPFMAFIQFPWRFLGIVALCTAATWSILIDSLSVNKKIIFIIIISILSITGFNNFRFEKYFPKTNDQTLLTGQEFERQQLSAVSDYLPITSKKIPNKVIVDVPVSSNGNVEITYYEKRSNYFTAQIDVRESNTVVTFPISYFPGWIVYDNNDAVTLPMTYDNDYGQITLSLTKGHHLIQAFFENTPIREISNTITFISLFVLVTSYLVLKENDEKK